MWIGRRPFRHRPGFEDAVEFEPEIIVQPRRVVLLDDEPPAIRRLDGSLATRLGRLLEIALGTVCRKSVDHWLVTLRTQYWVG